MTRCWGLAESRAEGGNHWARHLWLGVQPFLYAAWFLLPVRRKQLQQEEKFQESIDRIDHYLREMHHERGDLIGGQNGGAPEVRRMDEPGPTY
jgi:hypothetical protein